LGVLAADSGLASLGGANLSCTLGDAAIGETSCQNLTFGLWINATPNSLRVQDNLCADGIAGLWIQLPGAVTPGNLNAKAAVNYYPQIQYFEEFLLLNGYAGALPPPVDGSPTRPRVPVKRVSEIRFRLPPTPMNSLRVQGNTLQNLVASGATASSSAALMLALCRTTATDWATTPEMSLIVSDNICRTGSGTAGPCALITLPDAPLASISTNVFVNAMGGGSSQDWPSLWLEVNDMANGVLAVSAVGNVFRGTSNLNTATRTGIATPANVWAVFNADPV
jgi:hypothetical protein